jgi:5'-nucleotidase
MDQRPPPDRPLALLSNDDGYRSEGLRAMRVGLVEAGFDVVTLAPETEQSASSHSLSLNRAMRLRPVETGVFALDGTPADCVYVALHAGTRVLPRRPDVVVAGINHGMNLGQDAFYSGTIAAAREGALRGIPAVAASAHPSLDLGPVAAATADLATRALAIRQRQGCLLSLNFPPAWKGQFRAAHLGTRFYDEIVDFRRDPRGREYLWVGGPAVRHERDAGSDTDAYDDGFASITPLLLDLTNERELDTVAKLVGREGRG